jgi:hypothetical protein
VGFVRLYTTHTEDEAEEILDEGGAALRTQAAEEAGAEVP